MLFQISLLICHETILGELNNRKYTVIYMHITFLHGKNIFFYSKQLGRIFWKWFVHKDWPHCIPLCTVLPKLAFFLSWSGPSTSSRHVRQHFFFPGLDDGRSTFIPKRSLIAHWVYFCKPLECVRRCCSCGRINDIAIS